MKKRNFFICLVAFSLIFLVCSSAGAKENAESFEIPVKKIDSISVNHEQGSISLKIQDVSYFYYLPQEDGNGLILASSMLLRDIQRAKTIQIRSIPYGFHREIINLLLFYGKRTIPDKLKYAPKKDDERICRR